MPGTLQPVSDRTSVLHVLAGLADARTAPADLPEPAGDPADGVAPVPAGPDAPSAVELADVLCRAYALLLAASESAVCESADAAAHATAAGWLLRSVVRPLGTTLAAAGGLAEAWPRALAAGHTVPPVDAIGTEVFTLAREVTALRALPGAPPELAEATAALQALACDLAPPEGADCADGRVARFRALQSGLDSAITVMPDGPYLATNTDRMVDWLGRVQPSRPQLALCRCGSSASKPFCDGAHARTGWSDPKADDRVADRRDTYVGQQVTVFDNRGICAHSGLCTDRLAGVFHVDSEPFVTPSGARMDEIIRAVRDCPSGALSYALAERECREDVDQDRPAQIEVSKDGPYRITGGIALLDATGADVPRNEGASREHYSLCRCGTSTNKPFCSGAHWECCFSDPVPDAEHEPTLFEWAGGLPVLLRMTRIFYEKYVPEDPLLRPLFADMEPDHPQRVAAWLGEVFHGPDNYSGRYGGYTRMVSQHIGKGITEQQRARWVALLSRSADEAGVPKDPEFRSAFVSYLEWGSRLAVENSQPDSEPPMSMPMPHWDWGTAGPPGIRVSALAHRGEEPDDPIVAPDGDEQISFERHVRCLFRRRDRQSMTFAFDLWSYDDVSQHAAAILDRVRNGSMPCDMTWPPEQVETFSRWIDSGMAP
jgi:CDGSH-type Zn-finger protein